MSEVVFIGDEITAAGYRTAGVTVHVASASELERELEAAGSRAAVLLLSAELAHQLPPRRLAELLSKPAPLLLLVPDVANAATPEDLGALVRRQLAGET